MMEMRCWLLPSASCELGSVLACCLAARAGTHLFEFPRAENLGQDRFCGPLSATRSFPTVEGPFICNDVAIPIVYGGKLRRKVQKRAVVAIARKSETRSKDHWVSPV